MSIYPWTLEIEQAAPMWRTFGKLRFVLASISLELHCPGIDSVDDLVTLRFQGLILEYPFVIPVSLFDSMNSMLQRLFRQIDPSLYRRSFRWNDYGEIDKLTNDIVKSV